jgi:protein SCO1/2
MHRQHGPLRVSALGPLTLASIVFATALIVGEPHARADTPQVTVGGPFTLTAPDGTTVTDATYRDKWLLVFFGYTFCPDTCPTTLMKIAGALEKLRPDATRLQPTSSPSILSATHPT